MSRLNAIVGAVLVLAACGPGPVAPAPHVAITTTTTERINTLPDFGSKSPVSRPTRVSRSVARSRPATQQLRPAGDDVWRRLANCESSNGRDSANGRYHGFFQWSLATWAGMGYSGDPHTYSYEFQKAASVRLQARSGWGQWPTCARKLGLL